MTDVENQVFQRCADAFRAAYPNGFIAGEYVPQPPKFPAVSVVEMDNTIHTAGRDTANIENYADVMYQIDAYSNLSRGKKVQAKAIIALIDNEMAKMGFTRSFLNPVQNFNDATIYRMTARYRAVVGRDETIYRR